MWRIFIFCVTCFCLFLVVPTSVHGEKVVVSKIPPNSEKIGKSRNGLFGNLEKLDNMLKDKTESVDAVLQETVKSIDKTEAVNAVLQETVKSIDKAVTNLSKPTESKPVTSKIETTGNLLNKTVKTTVSTIDKPTSIVTDTVGKTTSEVTNVVNDIVNSAIDELPTIPVVTSVVKDVSKTVTKTTNSVQTVAENTGELVNETLKSVSSVSNDAVIEPVEIVEEIDKVDKEIKPPQKIIKITDKEKTIIGNENSFDDLKERSSDLGSVPEPEPINPLASDMRTDGLVKQVGTNELEKHNNIVLDDRIEISMNDEVDLAVDSILEETFVAQQSVVTKLKVIDRVIGLIDPFVIFNTKVLEKNNVDNSSLPTKSSKERNIIPVASITEAPPPIASPTFSTVGESDLSFWGIVDVFSLQSSSGRKWIHIDEDAMVLWIHAPPGKPPQQSPFLM